MRGFCPRDTLSSARQVVAACQFPVDAFQTILGLKIASKRQWSAIATIVALILSLRHRIQPLYGLDDRKGRAVNEVSFVKEPHVPCQFRQISGHHFDCVDISPGGKRAFHKLGDFLLCIVGELEKDTGPEAGACTCSVICDFILYYHLSIGLFVLQKQQQYDNSREPTTMRSLCHTYLSKVSDVQAFGSPYSLTLTSSCLTAAAVDANRDCSERNFVACAERWVARMQAVRNILGGEKECEA